ncbi:FUSC family protein [Janibacter limosus]|uniref:FUSC family protein n=1 Tax=Janibacter limosus TaxID=53458 RepID=UPI001FE0A0E2|nr:aromatic acid exporter family protein [Janibacter limosus]
MTKPEAVTEVLQLVKGVVAGTAAWWLSVNVLESQLPFLAPWTALLTVHATVYRSLSRGLQTTIASAIGIALSFAIGVWLGVSLWTFALALLVGMIGARMSWIRDEGVAIATTAVFVLGSGFNSQAPLLGDRMLEVCVGVGLAVNFLLIPPMRDIQATQYMDSINRQMGDVLNNMASEFATSWDTDQADAWLREAESMSAELELAWQTVRFARESERVNPRTGLRRRRTRTGQTQGPGIEMANYENILERADEGVVHLRHLARTLREGAQIEGEWDARFRERWVEIVGQVGHAFADEDADVEAEPIQERLIQLGIDLQAEGQLPPQSWPLYGSLIASMSHIAAIADDITSARAAGEPSGAHVKSREG